MPDDGGSRRVVAWAPDFARKPRVRTVEQPVPPGPYGDPFGELGLDVRPVSVTPPRTWRRAAWFSIAASSIALVGLGFAAVQLSGPDSRPDRIDGLPRLPAEVPLAVPASRPAVPITTMTQTPASAKVASPNSIRKPLNATRGTRSEIDQQPVGARPAARSADVTTRTTTTGRQPLGSQPSRLRWAEVASVQVRRIVVVTLLANIDGSAPARTAGNTSTTSRPH